jgi:hypothetical protein
MQNLLTVPQAAERLAISKRNNIMQVLALG